MMSSTNQKHPADGCEMQGGERCNQRCFVSLARAASPSRGRRCLALLWLPYSSAAPRQWRGMQLTFRVFAAAISLLVKDTMYIFMM
jgi:hypothetical protein